jgi:putative lipoic acid-binding regulatory protein
MKNSDRINPIDKKTEEELLRLQILLDQEYAWPTEYLFKFIVKQETASQLIELFRGAEIAFKESAKGNYVSATLNLKMNTSAEVIEIYKKAARIPNIISL